MNTSVFILVPSTLISLLLFPLSFVHPSPSPADRVPICSPVDLLQGQHGRPLSAVTRQADLNVGEPLTVRLIYFHPRDREPQPFIDRHIDGLIRDAQQSYAEQLESHGFGRRTFRYETDATGKAVVHHVKGKFDDAYYHRSTFDKVIHTETAEQFDLSRNVYLVVLDVSTATIDGYCGQGAYLGPEGGAALVPAPNSDLLRERGWSCSNVAVTAHELGHVFGLAHDHFRNATRAPTSYDVDGMGRSSCAVEWLDGHRYFNVDRTYPDADEPTTIRMLPPLPIPPHSIRLRFEVTDSDGLHQAQLHNSTGEAVNCQGINGERARVEFVTPEVTEAPGNVVTLRVVDVYGNITEKRYPIDLTALLTPEVVSIPDANLAAVVRETLGLDTGDDVTQLDMLRLRHLEAPARQIRDLTGLEHAVNLKGLSLTENQIRDITPLAESTIMEVSDLHTNSISDLSPLAGMTNLSYLNLNDNSVSDLSPLEGLTFLGNLELRANSISDLSPLAGMTNLSYLNLNGNSVSDISPLEGLTFLETLALNANSISDLSPLAGMTNLSRLNLNDNSVSDISPLEGLTFMQYLELHGNSISDLSPLAGMTNLSRLNLNDNSVSDISPLEGLTFMQYLELHGNSISDLSPLVGMIDLRFLHLAENSVSDLSPLEDLTFLGALELRANSISDLSPLAGMTNLSSLES